MNIEYTVLFVKTFFLLGIKTGIIAIPVLIGAKMLLFMLYNLRSR